MFQRNNGPRHFEKKKEQEPNGRGGGVGARVCSRDETSKGQGSRIEGRGTKVKIDRSKTKAKVPVSFPVNHCSSPVLWPRPECTASRGATDAFLNKNTSTWNKPFQPPLRRLPARAVIASRAFGFAFVDLFVDQDDSFFFWEWLKLPTVCKSHQRKAPTS